MKNINSSMLTNLMSTCPTTATCWLLTLENGTKLGFTDHDTDLTFGGITYKAATGFLRANTEVDKDLSASNLELESVLDEESISADDLSKGIYDNGELTIFLVDYTNLPSSETDASAIEVLRGQLGQTVLNGDTFKIEGRSLTDKLSLQYSSVTSTLCTHSFCDVEKVPFTACRLNREDFEIIATVTYSTPDLFNISYSPTGEPNTYRYGICEFTTGQNAGFRSTIKRDNGGQIQLYVATPYRANIGDQMKLLKGCDKTLEQCKSYQNTINFGGVGVYTPLESPYRARLR